MLENTKRRAPFTHLTDGTLYPHKTDKIKNDPEARGLTPYNNIKWFIPERAIKDARGVKIKRLHNDQPLNLTSYKELKKIEKQLKEQEEDAERARILKERTDEQTQADEARRIKAEQLEDQLKEIGGAFKQRANLKLHEQKKAI